jgi:hypothetical protein
VGSLSALTDALRNRVDVFVDGLRADPLGMFEFDIDLSDSFAAANLTLAETENRTT